MDEVATEEKKPFDTELIKDEDDAQPDPDEVLNMDQGNGRVWSVKIPKHLMQKWSAITEDNIHLATIRVYDPDPLTNKQRIMLILPKTDRPNLSTSNSASTIKQDASASPSPGPGGPSGTTTPTQSQTSASAAGTSTPLPMSALAQQPSASSSTSTTLPTSTSSPSTSSPMDTDPSAEPEPDEYELEMVNDIVENQIVIAERELTPGSRARTTILTGRIKHDCNLRPLFTESYRRRMRNRHRAANTPARQIRFIDDAIAGGRGGVNMLSSGIAPSQAGFSSFLRNKNKPVKGQFERFARIPRNQLLDMLFALYRERPRWSAKDLRSRTEQPEAYLKEVLAEIADLHRSGEFNGLYELKPNFRETVKADPDNAASIALVPKTEGGVETIEIDDDEEEEDEDDDMEEVS